MVATPKKDNVVINMVLQLPLVVRYPKMWYSRRKNLSRTKAWLISKKRKSFNVHLKKLLRTYNKRSRLKLVYKFGLKPTSPRISIYIVKISFPYLLNLSILSVLPNLLMLLNLLVLPILSVLLEIPVLPNLSKILEQQKQNQFWKISTTIRE